MSDIKYNLGLFNSNPEVFIYSSFLREIQDVNLPLEC